MAHRHTHDASEYNWAFAVGGALNVGFVVVEAVFGFLAGSLALLADAGHNAGDVLGLFLAWGANMLMQRPPTRRHTYGWRGSSILAALLNALILLVAVGGIVREAVGRFVNPEPVASATIIWVAVVGTVINLATALLFVSGRKRDLNVRGAFTHMAADAGVSAGVVVVGLAIRATAWLWLDPAVSLVIAGVIFWGTWGVLRDAFNLAIGGAPQDIDVTAVHDYLIGLPGVEDVHDLHVWGLSTAEVALTAHLVKPDPCDDDVLVEQATGELQVRFDIDHVTLQWERGGLAECRDRACDKGICDLPEGERSAEERDVPTA
jgi:cobalt-zinc-cadmium efflux system protein